MPHRLLITPGIILQLLVLTSAAASAQPAPGVRGIVRAEAAATISTELTARIDSLPFKPGQSFRAGDVLIAFDCKRYEADLRAAEAAVRTEQISVETNRSLLEHRATGTNDLALAEAKLDQASATADSLRVRTAGCRISAPYDGHIVERTVDVFEMPQAGAPLLKIIKDGQLDIDLIVPSQWAVWLTPGYEFPFRIEETGTTHKARLTRIGAAVDPVSRTIKVSAQLLDRSAAVKPGMSGTAEMAGPPAGLPEAN